MIFDHFDRIRIVSLPERSDRRKAMRAELRTVGLAGDPRVVFFDAFRMDHPGPFRRIGSHGNFRSHVTILGEAASAGESVLILEDDCDFLPLAQTYEPPADWDIFYGGYYASNPDDLHSSNIIGSHFIGFSAAAAKKAHAYLTALLDPATPADPTAAAEAGFDPAVRPPIDGAYVWFRRAHPELRTEFAPLGKQRPSRSDVAPLRLFDRTPMLRQVTAVVRNLKRRLAS